MSIWLKTSKILMNSMLLGIRARGSGFPSSKGAGFMGAGDIDRKYHGVKEFLETHPDARIIKKIGIPIPGLSPPKLMNLYTMKS